MRGWEQGYNFVMLLQVFCKWLLIGYLMCHFSVVVVHLYLFLNYTQLCSFSLQRQIQVLSLGSVCSVQWHDIMPPITANHRHVKLVAKNPLMSLYQSLKHLYETHPCTSLVS